MMNYSNYWNWSSMFPLQYPYMWILAPLIVWSLIWKGWALWKAARSGNKGWFVVLLVVNTIGVLEILYIYIFSKKSGRIKGENSI